MLAYRRAKGDEVIVCIFNLSPETLGITVTGDAEVVIARGAERQKSRLTLAGNGFVYFRDAPGEAPLDVKFNRRKRKGERHS